MGCGYGSAALAVGVALATAGCTSHGGNVASGSYVQLPAYRGYALDDLLRRLHALGLRASYSSNSPACGNGLPAAVIPSPRAPARVKKGSTIRLKFMYRPIPTPAVPDHHPRWTHVPGVIGKDFRQAAAGLVAIWPCVHVQSERSTSGTRLIVVSQDPPASARVRAYGVLSKRGYRPTTVSMTVAARP